MVNSLNESASAVGGQGRSRYDVSDQCEVHIYVLIDSLTSMTTRARKSKLNGPRRVFESERSKEVIGDEVGKVPPSHILDNLAQHEVI